MNSTKKIIRGRCLAPTVINQTNRLALGVATFPDYSYEDNVSETSDVSDTNDLSDTSDTSETSGSDSENENSWMDMYLHDDTRIMPNTNPPRHYYTEAAWLAPGQQATLNSRRDPGTCAFRVDVLPIVDEEGDQYIRNAVQPVSRQTAQQQLGTFVPTPDQIRSPPIKPSPFILTYTTPARPPTGSLGPYPSIPIVGPGTNPVKLPTISPGGYTPSFGLPVGITTLSPFH